MILLPGMQSAALRSNFDFNYRQLQDSITDLIKEGYCEQAQIAIESRINEPVEPVADSAEFEIIRVSATHSERVQWLSCAAFFGKAQLLDHCIGTLKLEVNTRYPYGYHDSLLGSAAHQGHLEVVRVLLMHRGDVDCENDLKETPLFHAVAQGHCDVARELIEAGADVNHANCLGDTPLLLAMNSGNNEMIDLLLSKNADITYHNTTSHLNAIGHALVTGRAPLVVFALSKGAPIINVGEAKKTTSLHHAALLGSLAIAKILVEQNACLYALDEDNKTPCDIADENSHYEVAQFLQEIEIERSKVQTYIEAKDRYYENNALHIALRNAAPLSKFQTIIKESPYLATRKNIQGETPLACAKKMRRYDVVRYLEDPDRQIARA